MKLINQIAEMIDDSKQAEAGDTDMVAGHWHKTEIDVGGNGKTIQTLPDTHPEHSHEIKSWEAQSVNDHEHKVIA